MDPQGTPFRLFVCLFIAFCIKAQILLLLALLLLLLLFYDLLADVVVVGGGVCCLYLYLYLATEKLYVPLIFASHVLLSLSAFYFAPLPSSIFDKGLKGCCFHLGWWNLAKRK